MKKVLLAYTILYAVGALLNSAENPHFEMFAAYVIYLVGLVVIYVSVKLWEGQEYDGED